MPRIAQDSFVLCVARRDKCIARPPLFHTPSLSTSWLVSRGTHWTRLQQSTYILNTIYPHTRHMSNALSPAAKLYLHKTTPECDKTRVLEPSPIWAFWFTVFWAPPHAVTLHYSFYTPWCACAQSRLSGKFDTFLFAQAKREWCKLGWSSVLYWPGQKTNERVAALTVFIYRKPRDTRNLAA